MNEVPGDAGYDPDKLPKGHEDRLQKELEEILEGKNNEQDIGDN